MLFTHPTLQFSIVDFDIVEQRNITAGTQPYSKADFNRPKTQALQRLAQTLQGKKINGYANRMESVQDIKKLITTPSETVIIDAFDNAKSRNLFLRLDKGYNVLHVGFSALLTGEAVWNESYSEMTESKKDAAIDVCQMHIARPFIMALTAIASLSLAKFIDDGKKSNVYFDSGMKIIVF
jgi:hypothetical protein